MRLLIRKAFSSFTFRAWLWLLTVAWLYVVAVANDLPSTHLLWSSFAAVLVICLLLSRAALSGLSVNLCLPSKRVTAGSTLSLDVNLNNKGSFVKSSVVLECRISNQTFGLPLLPQPPLPLSGKPLPRLVRIEAGRRKKGDLTKFLLPEVSPRASLRVSTLLDVRLRGLWHVEQARLAGGDPLGLFRLEAPLNFRASFIALPRYDLYRWVDEEVSASTLGKVSIRLPGEGEEFHSLRPYEPGDDLRRIHWRATAKAGRLIVKTFERSKEEQRLVALDLREQFEWGEAPRSAEERKVEVSASLLYETVRRGGRCGLVIAGNKLALLPLSGSRGHFMSALEALALARPGVLPLREALSRGLPVGSPGTTFVLVTSAYDEEVLWALEAAKARGMIASCVLVMPPPDTHDDHFRKVEELAALLAEAGWPTVVVSPLGGDEGEGEHR